MWASVKITTVGFIVLTTSISVFQACHLHTTDSARWNREAQALPVLGMLRTPETLALKCFLSRMGMVVQAYTSTGKAMVGTSSRPARLIYNILSQKNFLSSKYKEYS